MMKFDYHIVRWGLRGVVRNLPRIFKEMSDAGFTALETHDVNIVPFFDNKQGFLDLLSENGLHVVAVYCPGQFIPKNFIDSLILRFYWKEIKRFTRFAEFTASIGGKKLIIGGTIGVGGTKEKHYRILANKLNAIGKACNNLGIKQTYHPHLKTMVENLQQIETLLKLTDPDLVNLTLETGHMYMAGIDLINFINNFHERINHVHFKDIKDGKFVELGEGEIDFPRIMKALRNIGYDDWVTIEDEVNTPDIQWAGTTTRTPLETAINSRRYSEKLNMIA
jgi:inosose dehydratase